MIGEAFGSAYVTMNSKSIGADIVYAWPQAKIGMMDAQSAVKIMYSEEIEKSENAAALISEKAAEYEKLKALPRQRQEEDMWMILSKQARQENA